MPGPRPIANRGPPAAPLLPANLSRCGRRRADGWLGRSVQGIADTDRRQPVGAAFGILRRQLKAEITPTKFFGHGQGRCAAAERIEHEIAFGRAKLDDAAEQLFRHLTAVKSGPLFERAGNAREVPGVFGRSEAARQILRSQDPRIVRQAAGGVGPIVGIHQLPGRGDAVLQLFGPEGELLGVFDKVKQVGVRPAELILAVHAKRVVPDDPTTRVETDLLAGNFEFGRVLVADSQPERARLFQRAVDRRNPRPRPIEIATMFLAVAIDVIFVADVERRIGEGQIDLPGGHGHHPLDTVALDDLVPSSIRRHAHSLLRSVARVQNGSQNLWGSSP